MCLNIEDTSPLLRFLIAGQLQRETIVTPSGQANVDIPGGNILYAAAGMGIWDKAVGLISRVGEDYPVEWLDKVKSYGFDTHGVRILPESIDLRAFHAYPDRETHQTDNPVAAFARIGQPFPRSLLGFTDSTPAISNRTQPSSLTIRQTDIPVSYLDATAAHLCPLDYLSHSLIPTALRQGHVTTISLDPSAGYMNPIFWDNFPGLLKGITAFICNEDKITSLFQGRTVQLWQMAEGIASFGCDIVIIKRGAAGQILYNNANHTRWIIPAYPSQVIDPTGAGDSFCGGWLAGFRETYDPLEAALFGNISASFTVEGSGPFYPLGALPGLPQARMESLRDRVRRA